MREASKKLLAGAKRLRFEEEPDSDDLGTLAAAWRPRVTIVSGREDDLDRLETFALSVHQGDDDATSSVEIPVTEYEWLSVPWEHIEDALGAGQVETSLVVVGACTETPETADRVIELASQVAAGLRRALEDGRPCVVVVPEPDLEAEDAVDARFVALEILRELLSDGVHDTADGRVSALDIAPCWEAVTPAAPVGLATPFFIEESLRTAGTQVDRLRRVVEPGVRELHASHYWTWDSADPPGELHVTFEGATAQSPALMRAISVALFSEARQVTLATLQIPSVVGAMRRLLHRLRSELPTESLPQTLRQPGLGHFASHVAPTSSNSEPATSDERESSAPRRKPSHDELKSRAFVVLQRSPFLSLPQIAGAVGMNKSTIYKDSWKGFRDAWATMHHGDVQRVRPGFVSASSGNVEAVAGSSFRSGRGRVRLPR